MIRTITLFAMALLGFAFWRWMTVDLLTNILQPLVVALSIMAAALLVRLNRGMPTLDWKSLEVSERKVLTQKIVELGRDYVSLLAFQFVTLIALLLLILNKSNLADLPFGPKGALTVIGALLALCVCRMGYIVWRDSDIIRLQKKLIDDSADREAAEKASATALSNVASIRASGLRDPTAVERTSWPDNNRESRS